MLKHLKFDTQAGRDDEIVVDIVLFTHTTLLTRLFSLAGVVVLGKEMQASHGGPRRKLNRNAFKLEHGPVPKRRRVSVSSSRSECTAPVADVHAEPSTARETSHAHQQEPSRATRNHEPSQCTLRDCNNNNISDNNEDDDNISASRRKEIRCHLHLALRCCFEKSASRADAEQSVSCTVSRLVNGDVRVETSSSTGDALEPHAVCAGKSGVKQEDTPVEAAEKKDGRAAHPSKNRSNVCVINTNIIHTIIHKDKLCFVTQVGQSRGHSVFCTFDLGKWPVV